MKKFLLPAIALSASIVAVLLFAASAAHAGVAVKSKSNKPANDTYMVVKIINENKTDQPVEYKVITTSQLKDEEKKVKEDNAQKMKEWRDEKKADPTAPPPKRILLKKIPKLTGFETQKVAQEQADKLKQQDADKDAGDAKPKSNKK